MLFIWQCLILETVWRRRRENNSLLLSGKTRLKEEILISNWVLRETFSAIEFSLPTPLLFFLSLFWPREVSPNCCLWLKVNFPLAKALCTCHCSMPCCARVQADKPPTCLLIKEGRGSLKGTLLTEGKESPIAAKAHATLPQWPQRSLFTKAIVREERARRKGKRCRPWPERSYVPQE